MTTIDRMEIDNKHHFEELKIKPMFQHCLRCTGAIGCYTDNSFGLLGHPNFLDPDCYKGPILPKEEET